MGPSAILSAIVLVPLILFIVLRVNAAIVFLSLCLGDVLVQFVSSDANNLLSIFSAQTNQNMTAQTLKLVLLLAPAILTTIFMMRTVRGHSRLLLNILPAAGVGLLCALLAVPLFSAGLRHNIVDSTLWQQLQRAQDLVVGLSACMCLLVLLLQRPKVGGSEGGKHAKRHKE